MDYRKKFVVEPGSRVRLGKIDPAFKDGHESHDTAMPEIQKHVERMAKLQYLLYADGNQSLLVVLQALDAGGKDGTIRAVMSGVNPQGCVVTPFKVPTSEEAEHDFLWRIHRAVPQRWSVSPMFVPSTPLRWSRGLAEVVLPLASRWVVGPRWAGSHWVRVKSTSPRTR